MRLSQGIAILVLIGTACATLLFVGSAAAGSVDPAQPLTIPEPGVVIETNGSTGAYTGTLERGESHAFNVSIIARNVTAGTSIDLSLEVSAIYADGNGSSTGDPDDIGFSLEPAKITFPHTVSENGPPGTYYATMTVNVTADARDSDCFVIVRARGDTLNPSPAGNYHFVIGNGGNLPDRTPGPSPDQPVANHIFSIYGTVLDEDGTPIPNTTIRLLEPNGSSFDPAGPGIRLTVTDDLGNFRFVNVTTGSDVCGIAIEYPDHRQYFPPGNSFRTVETSGTQYVNVTRIKIESDAPPSTTPSTPADAFLVIVTMALACLFRKREP